MAPLYFQKCLYYLPSPSISANPLPPSKQAILRGCSVQYEALLATSKRVSKKINFLLKEYAVSLFEFAAEASKVFGSCAYIESFIMVAAQSMQAYFLRSSTPTLKDTNFIYSILPFLLSFPSLVARFTHNHSQQRIQPTGRE